MSSYIQKIGKMIGKCEYKLLSNLERLPESMSMSGNKSGRSEESEISPTSSEMQNIGTPSPTSDEEILSEVRKMKTETEIESEPEIEFGVGTE